jgi:hypothetical protein
LIASAVGIPTVHRRGHRERGADVRGPCGVEQGRSGGELRGKQRLLKVSPAPVVSQTVAGRGGRCSTIASRFDDQGALAAERHDDRRLRPRGEPDRALRPSGRDR